MKGRAGSTEDGGRQRQRPEHFSTYVPRDVVRRLKVVATIRDVPMWSLVTAALESYLASFERAHGRLPRLADDHPRAKE